MDTLKMATDKIRADINFVYSNPRVKIHTCIRACYLPWVENHIVPAIRGYPMPAGIPVYPQTLGNLTYMTGLNTTGTPKHVLRGLSVTPAFLSYLNCTNNHSLKNLLNLSAA
jgi:hypothetical protein